MPVRRPAASMAAAAQACRRSSRLASTSTACGRAASKAEREVDTRDIGLMTGYYEPLLRGSRSRSDQYSTPIYRVPPDLLVVDLGSVYPELSTLRLRGKLQGRRVVPYRVARRDHERRTAGRQRTALGR